MKKEVDNNKRYKIAKWILKEPVALGSISGIMIVIWFVISYRIFHLSSNIVYTGTLVLAISMIILTIVVGLKIKD